MSKKQIVQLLDDDEIDSDEAGFMFGYEGYWEE